MKYFVIFLVLIGFVGITYAEEIPVMIQTPNDIDLIITDMVEISATKEDPLVTILIENEVGYPFGVHPGNIKECVDFVLEKRTPMEIENEN